MESLVIILVIVLGISIMVISLIVRGIKAQKLVDGTPKFKLEGLMIAALTKEHRTGWLNMWDRYLEFYNAEVSQEISLATYDRLINPELKNICGLVALNQDGEVIGIANYVLHPFTWGLEDACYLEDLFVHPSYRGQGIGRSLIDELISLGKKNKWARLYWHTHKDNTTARKLYDTYGKADDFVKYQLPIRW